MSHAVTCCHILSHQYGPVSPPPITASSSNANVRAWLCVGSYVDNLTMRRLSCVSAGLTMRRPAIGVGTSGAVLPYPHSLDHSPSSPVASIISEVCFSTILCRLFLSWRDFRLSLLIHYRIFSRIQTSVFQVFTRIPLWSSYSIRPFSFLKGAHTFAVLNDNTNLPSVSTGPVLPRSPSFISHKRMYLSSFYSTTELIDRSLQVISNLSLFLHLTDTLDMINIFDDCYASPYSSFRAWCLSNTIFSLHFQPWMKARTG